MELDTIARNDVASCLRLIRAKKSSAMKRLEALQDVLEQSGMYRLGSNATRAKSSVRGWRLAWGIVQQASCSRVSRRAFRFPRIVAAILSVWKKELARV